jgi:hypothetical protein
MVQCPAGLPVLLPDGGHRLTVIGNGTTIQRSPVEGAPTFRLFTILTDTTVSLVSVTFQYRQQP